MNNMANQVRNNDVEGTGCTPQYIGANGIRIFFFFFKLIARMHNLSGRRTSHPEIRVDSDGRAS